MRPRCTNGWAHSRAEVMAAARKEGSLCVLLWHDVENASLMFVGKPGNQRAVLVDREDAAWLSAYYWMPHPRGIITRIAGSQGILLHRCIMHATPDLVVTWKNGCHDDCRKTNLLVVKRKDLARKQTAARSLRCVSHSTTGLVGVNVERMVDRHGKARRRAVGTMMVAGKKFVRAFYESDNIPLPVAIKKAHAFRRELEAMFFPGESRRDVRPRFALAEEALPQTVEPEWDLIEELTK